MRVILRVVVDSKHEAIGVDYLVDRLATRRRTDVVVHVFTTVNGLNWVRKRSRQNRRPVQKEIVVKTVFGGVAIFCVYGLGWSLSQVVRVDRFDDNGGKEVSYMVTNRIV